MFEKTKIHENEARDVPFKNVLLLAVVVAQLVDWSLPTPEVRGSNPVIRKIYIEHMFTVKCVLIEKAKIKQEAVNGPHKKGFAIVLTDYNRSLLCRYQVIKFSS